MCSEETLPAYSLIGWSQYSSYPMSVLSPMVTTRALICQWLDFVPGTMDCTLQVL